MSLRIPGYEHMLEQSRGSLKMLSYTCLCAWRSGDTVLDLAVVCDAVSGRCQRGAAQFDRFSFFHMSQ